MQKSNMPDLSKTQPDEQVYKVGKFLFKALANVMLPTAAGTISEVFDLFISDPAQRRRDAFLMALAKRLDELAEVSAFDPATLVSNDETSAYLMQAIQIALRSRGEQKLAALREATLRGTIAADDIDRAPGYVVLNLLDRFTEYHIILLRWESAPQRGYTGREILEGHTEGLMYGQPVTTDPSSLKEPWRIPLGLSSPIFYVEKQTAENFRLAHSDLVAMGLLVPKYQIVDENFGRPNRQPDYKQRLLGHEVSETGRLVVSYTKPVEIVSDDQSSTGL